MEAAEALKAMEAIKTFIETKKKEYRSVDQKNWTSNFVKELEGVIKSTEPKIEKKPTEPLIYKKYKQMEAEYKSQGKSLLGAGFNTEAQRHAEFIPDFFD